MASEIRALLGAAQSAEVKGDTAEAVRLLREAAAFYRDRKLVTRAMQMLRHARRLEGHQDPGPPLDGFAPRELINGDDDFDGPTGEHDWSNEQFGFGDELLETNSARSETDSVRGAGLEAPSVTSEFERILTLADPALDAWCSFCCRPTREVGPLTAGPAGAYICAACTTRSGEILGSPVRVEPVTAPARHSLLATQSAALETYSRRSPRLALVIGPEGAGKSELVRAIASTNAAVTIFDAVPPDENPRAPAVIAVRGSLPAVALVLDGEHGPEPVYDTDSLAAASGLPKSLLSKVDAVFALPVLGAAELHALATTLLEARGISLPAKTIDQLTQLAAKSGRSAHELVALVARIPAGQYQSS